MIVPAWINPSFKVIEEGKTYDWASINALAERLGPDLPLGSRVAVTARSVPTLLASLVAAQRVGVELVLLRGAMSRFAGASVQIAKDGQLVRLGPGISVNAQAFAVLIPTSGTTGEPKLVRQDFTRLIGRVRGNQSPDSRWLLTYEPTAFGGLQVILAAVTSGATLVAAPAVDSTELARLALEHRVTHISATPCVWRTLLGAFGTTVPPLKMVTLGGDIVDQPLLDRLVACFPKASLRRIYASSEAGVVFSGSDAKVGFPTEWLESGIGDIELRVRGGALQVRSPRAMLSYAGGEARPFTRDGWLMTGDLVERVGDRVHFTGRIETLVVVNGVKVSPAKAEVAILEVPGVLDVLVQGVPDPASGNALAATVAVKPEANTEILTDRIRRHLETRLTPAERPWKLDFTDHIELALSGKKVRATSFQFIGASPVRPH
ncbi:MAG: fatty acid--CoA ligase family protein [Rhodospirillaceae bacterium]